jgi:2-dehydro-3-deoxyphosphogluconate aldolase/(4S)-4-hydroxy-2-oxoglutarate aldolase
MLVTDQPLATDARERIVQRLLGLGAVAVIRMQDGRDALRAIEAIHAGGVSAVEITMTMPNAIGVIEEAVRRLPTDVMVGVGSVLDPMTARRAIAAGACYVVSPVFERDVVDEAHQQGVPAMPGAFTPTEILRAHEAGADVVKVFPAEAFGPGFIKGVLAPMPFLRLMPTGGVTPDNAGEWIGAGAAAVGLGSALVDPKLVAAGDFDALTERARRLCQNVAEARQGSAGGSR